MPADRATVAVLSLEPVVVDGFGAMLGRHGDRVEVVGLPRVVEEVEVEPDIVLYDVAAPADGDGGDLDYLVRKTSCVVLAVGRELRPDLLSQALAYGADGFFSLGVDEDELLAAIGSAMTGWQAGDPGPDPVVGSSESEQRLHQLGRDVGLSDRETRVLSLIAQGLSNDEIASRDFLSVNSVKTYIRSAYRKIGVRNRTEAVVWALQHGFGTDVDASIFHQEDQPD